MNNKANKEKFLFFIIFLFIFIFGLFSFYFSKSFIILERPDYQYIGNNSLRAQSADLNESVATSEFIYDAIDFDVIGYRAGDGRTSLIIKTSEYERAMYVGDILANGIELLSIDYPRAVFQINGDRINLLIHDE